MTALCERMQNSLGLASAPGLPPLARAAVGGASDGNFTAGIGAPALDGLGATGGGAHADDEHVLAADLGGLAALMADVLREPQPSTATNAAPPSGARRP